VLDYEYYFKLTEAFIINNVGEVLVTFDEILDKGFDGHNFIVGLAKHFRDLLVCKDKVTLQLLEVGAKIKEMYLQQSGKVDQLWLFKALEIANNADLSYKNSTNQRLHIELALVQLSSQGLIEKKKSDQQLLGPDEIENTTIQLERKEIKPEVPEIKKEEKTNPSVNKIITGNSQVKKTISIKDALAGKHEIQEINEDDPLVENDDIERKEFTQKNINEVWLKFAKRFENEKPRIYNTFISHIPEKISDHLLELKLANNSQDEDIKYHKVELMYFLRSTFSDEELEIETKIEDNKDNGKRIYTDQDKYEYMVGKNPDLKKLKDQFNLDFM